jgi:hypothetical protein
MATAAQRQLAKLRPFYFRTHPDFFAQHPDKRSVHVPNVHDPCHLVGTCSEPTLQLHAVAWRAITGVRWYNSPTVGGASLVFLCEHLEDPQSVCAELNS